MYEMHLTKGRCSLVVRCTVPSGKIRIISTQSDLGGIQRDKNSGTIFGENIELKTGGGGNIGCWPIIEFIVPKLCNVESRDSGERGTTFSADFGTSVCWFSSKTFSKVQTQFLRLGINQCTFKLLCSRLATSLSYMVKFLL